jgi:hypothetical protein
VPATFGGPPDTGTIAHRPTGSDGGTGADSFDDGLSHPVSVRTAPITNALFATKLLPFCIAVLADRRDFDPMPGRRQSVKLLCLPGREVLFRLRPPLLDLIDGETLQDQGALEPIEVFLKIHPKTVL